MINNILPCNKNLTKWRIINDEKCPVCNLTHNIVHMLYECCHSRRLWATVSATLGINVSTDKILVGCQNQSETTVISIISFLIYKLYIRRETENAYVNWKNDFHFFLREIRHKIRIYSNCKNIKNILPKLQALTMGIIAIIQS